MILSSVLALILIPLWASNNSAFSLYANSQWVNKIALLTVLLIANIPLSLFCLRDNKTHFFYLFIVSFICLVSAWSVRWVTMMEVQTIAKFDVGPYPYHLPVGSNGLLGIIGMFGLWIALALLCSELVQPKQNINSTTLNQH